MSGRTSTTELHDPQTTKFRYAADMAAPRAGMTATLLKNGQVLIVGGESASNALQLIAEIYDPATNTFTQSGSLNRGRSAHYGIPKGRTGLLPWSHVIERMTHARCYWTSTVSPDGRRHATPVDGLWLDNQLYFNGSPRTRRNRNLAANPAVCVHLESGSDVVILHGDAHLHSPDRSLALRLAQSSREKYGYAPKPEEYEVSGVHMFRPRVVFAWKQFPRDATRWRLQND